MNVRHGSACVVVLAVWASFAVAEPITTGTLVNQMTDLGRLAEFPGPAYKTVQFSSYDHRSNLPGGEHWFGNSDGFGKEPIPNFESVITPPADGRPGEYLICDVHGPAAIVRTWTARIEGTIRLYLDGSDTPIYDGPAEAFLRRPWRTFVDQAGLDSSLFDNTYHQKDVGYFPIPFAKRCRMVFIGDLAKLHFYHVQIRKYEPSAEVVTFQPSDLTKYAEDIRRAARILAAPGETWEYQSTQKHALSVDLGQGEVKEALALAGPAAIESLQLGVEAADLDKALRQTILHIYFDEHPWAQVQAPLGDFFGAAPGVNPYDSVPFTVKPDGAMTCRFVMPFARSMRIVLDNRGDRNVSVTGFARQIGYRWDDNRSMHFRARWRVDHDLVADNNPPMDLPFLIANGSGVYVGTAVMLLNPNEIPHGVGNWWGEGDEKIFVDDDDLPSTFGTGSEDYFNYAWGVGTIFLYPYWNQARNDGPANRGFVVNNRWHVLDPLPFRERLAFYMELFPHERTPGFVYARIAYHYGRPGLIDDHVPITDEDVRDPQLPADYQPAPRGGMANTVFHQAEDLLANSAEFASREGRLYSGQRMLIWKPSASGEELALELPVAKAGNHAIHLAMGVDPQGGRVSATLDGTPLLGEVSLHAPYRTMLQVFSAGRGQLSAGKHKLTLRYAGPAEKGSPSPVIGIDWIGVQAER